MRVILALLGVLLVLAVPWAVLMYLEHNGLVRNEKVVAFLTAGGGRGRRIDMVFYAVPTSAAGFVVARIYGTKSFAKLAAMVLITTVLAFASLIGLHDSTSSWPLQVITDGTSFPRVVQVFLFVVCGAPFGYILWAVKRDQKQSQLDQKKNP